MTKKSWSATGDLAEMRAAFVSFHSEVQKILAAAPQVHKWGIYERDPLPVWWKGNVVLLGDACHPMTPYMASGAAMALEDAAVLARAIDQADTLDGAFRLYEQARKPRASMVQAGSSANTWMRNETNPDWLYGSTRRAFAPLLGRSRRLDLLQFMTTETNPRPALIDTLDKASTRRTTPVGDGDLVWRIWGHGEPLVLLHGGTGSWMHWMRNIEDLSRDYMLLVPDIPGSGESRARECRPAWRRSPLRCSPASMRSSGRNGASRSPASPWAG